MGRTSLPVLLLLLHLLSLTKSAPTPYFLTSPPSSFPSLDLPLIKDQIRGLFQHGYDSYMIHAFPHDELEPLTCSGHDTWGSYSLTLIDSLDSLLVFGNRTEFLRAINLVRSMLTFDKDVNTSVFESNIRVVGGLLSAHILAVSDEFDLKPPNYNNELLLLAEDLARRLLPAFNTTTGMPYGTVNFRNGVPENETPITCTSCTSTFSLEFGYLSLLTGDVVFEETAKKAVRGLWQRRSFLGLVGGHIDVQTGKWTQKEGGIGGGVDSYYEYLLKAALLFDDQEYEEMFLESYDIVEKYVHTTPWYGEINLEDGLENFPYYSNLQMFWAGVQVLLGDLNEARMMLEKIIRVYQHVSFLPETFNAKTGQILIGREGYPLRPELVESVWYLYRATKDTFWLHVGNYILETVEYYLKVPCGFANLINVQTYELENKMESFFLGETLKYLYLLFDEENHFNQGNYIFTTEAHPLPITKASLSRGKKSTEGMPILPQKNQDCDRFCQIKGRRGHCPNFKYHFGSLGPSLQLNEKNSDFVWPVCFGAEFFVSQ